MRISFIALLMAAAVCAIQAQPDVLQRAAKLEESGQFVEAASVLGLALAQGPAMPASERKAIEFELDRLDRIRKDYSLTMEQLFATLAKSVKDITPMEFEKWISEGRFDSREIDSVTYFMSSSRSNLFFRYPELANRRINPPDGSAFEESTWMAVTSIKRAAAEKNAPYVLPKQFKNTMTVTVKPNTAPGGEVVRAWLPIPRAFPHQISFNLLGSSSPVKTTAPPESPIRSVYLEQRAEQGKPTVFKVDYEYTAFGIWFDLKPITILPYNKQDPEYIQYTAEGPHVIFTDKIKSLSAELGGTEQNPLIRAKRFYDWISETIQYSYALEYSTIRNISEYCMNKKYGDCGQAALLFITLCRLNGIPARWQSGWLTMPGGKTIHDWTEINVPPYGWIPVDPYMGVFAMQYFHGPEAQRKEIRDFYFGGLDQYRMSANGDHNQELMPAKRSLRSDNVDFQRGELEFGDTNIYFDNYSFDLKVEEVK